MLIACGYLGGLFFTYIGAPLILFLASIRFQRQGPGNNLDICIVSFGLGPLLISRLLDITLQIFPHQKHFFYPSIIFGIYFLLFLYGLPAMGSLSATMKDIFYSIKKIHLRQEWLAFSIFCVVLILVAGLTLSAWQRPPTGGDTLEYATLARLIYQKSTNAFYLFSQADPETGFYSPMTHPLGYVTFITWHYFSQGTAGGFGFAKLISPWAALQTLLLLAYILRSRGLIYAVLGPLFLLLTYYSRLIQKCHIDPLQTYAYLLAFFCLIRAFKSPGRYWTAAAGISVGICMFIHSIGFLILPFAGLSWFFLSDAGSKKQRKRLVIIILLAILVGGQQYIENQLTRGRPLGDDVPAWQLPQIDHETYIRETRGLRTWGQRLISGVLQCWTKPMFFGITSYLGLAGLIMLIRRKQLDGFSRIGGLFLTFYFFLVFISFLIGTDLIIKNERYFIFIQPIFAYFAACFLGWIYERISINPLKRERKLI